MFGLKPVEQRDLLISWLSISLAFAWALSRLNLVDVMSSGQVTIIGFANTLPVSLIVVGTAFIFHELAHRYVAIHFGAHAEYRAWPTMLWVAVIFSFLFGIVLAAPGAVYTYGGRITRSKNGLISLAGPLTNAVLAIVFAFLQAYSFFPLMSEITFTGMYINLFLAVFNLLPLWQLDGAQVFAWKPLVWAGVFVPLALWLMIFF